MKEWESLELNNANVGTEWTRIVSITTSSDVLASSRSYGSDGRVWSLALVWELVVLLDLVWGPGVSAGLQGVDVEVLETFSSGTNSLSVRVLCSRSRWHLLPDFLYQTAVLHGYIAKPWPAEGEELVLGISEVVVPKDVRLMVAKRTVLACCCLLISAQATCVCSSPQEMVELLLLDIHRPKEMWALRNASLKVAQEMVWPSGRMAWWFSHQAATTPCSW